MNYDDTSKWIKQRYEKDVYNSTAQEIRELKELLLKMKTTDDLSLKQDYWDRIYELFHPIFEEYLAYTLTDGIVDIKQVGKRRYSI